MQQNFVMNVHVILMQFNLVKLYINVNSTIAVTAHVLHPHLAYHVKLLHIVLPTLVK